MNHIHEMNLVLPGVSDIAELHANEARLGEQYELYEYDDGIK